jgi:hypothetical protein
MTRLATGYFVFPTADVSKLGVRSVGESVELVFMTGFACITADVIFWVSGL